MPRDRSSSTGEFRYRMDQAGRQHFSFTQRVWLDPRIPMAFTRAHSTALVTLAVNMLLPVIRDRGARGNGKPGSRALLRLARDFAASCLLEAPPQGWIIPRAAIEAWLDSRGVSADGPQRERRRPRPTADRACTGGAD